MRLSAFRYLHEPEDSRHVGLVIGDGASWWVHPVDGWTDVVPLLVAPAPDREDAADRAAQRDGLLHDEIVLLPPVQPLVPMPVTGAFDDLPRPAGTARLDRRVLVAAVVRSAGPDGSRAQAAAQEPEPAVVGYCMLLTWTVPPAAGNDLDRAFAVTLGPWVATPEELGDGAGAGATGLGVVLRSNGVTYGRGPAGAVERPFTVVAAGAPHTSLVVAAEWSGTAETCPPTTFDVGDVASTAVERLGEASTRVVAAGDRRAAPWHTVA